MITIQQAIEFTQGRITQQQHEPISYFFCPVVALGWNNNIHNIDEFYNKEDEAMQRGKELVLEGYTLPSCGLPARDFGASKVKFDQHELIKHSAPTWSLEKVN